MSSAPESEKTYKREVAVTALTVTAVSAVAVTWHLIETGQSDLAVDLVKTFGTLSFAFAAGAFGIDWWSKQGAPAHRDAFSPPPPPPPAPVMPPPPVTGKPLPEGD